LQRAALHRRAKDQWRQNMIGQVISSADVKTHGTGAACFRLAFRLATTPSETWDSQLRGTLQPD